MSTPNLAMIPSGYKAAKLYSILPTDGTGDFTFAGSAVDRINSAGVSETVADNEARIDYQGEYVAPTDNSYYSFDGVSNDKVAITANAFSHGEDWSVSILCDLDASQDVNFSPIGQESVFGSFLFNSSGNHFRFRSSGGQYSGNGTYDTTTGVLGQGKKLVTFVNNNVNILVYVDDTLVDTLTLPSDTSITFNTIGTGYGGGSNTNGKIYKHWIDNRALSLGDVTNRFNGIAIDPKYIGANNKDLVTNGSATTDTDWTKSSAQWVISGGYFKATGNSTNSWISQNAIDKIKSGYEVELMYDVISNTLVGKTTIQVGGYNINADIFPNTDLALSGTVGTNKREVFGVPSGGDDLKTILAFRLNAATTGGSIEIDNIRVKVSGNTLLLDGGKTTTTWYDKTHAITGAVTGATLTNSNNFTNEVHPITTCPKLRLSGNITNSFFNSATPITQTVVTVIGTEYTISCNGVGLLTVDETGGNGRGGVVTEVDSFTYTATATSMVVTVVTAPNNVNFTNTSVPIRHIPTLGASVTKVKDQITQKDISAYATNNFEIYLEQEIFNPNESSVSFKLGDGVDYVSIYNGLLNFNEVSSLLSEGKNKIIIQNNASNLVAYVNGVLFLTGTRKTTILNKLDLTSSAPAIQEYHKLFYNDANNLSTASEMITKTT